MELCPELPEERLAPDELRPEELEGLLAPELRLGALEEGLLALDPRLEELEGLLAEPLDLEDVPRELPALPELLVLRVEDPLLRVEVPLLLRVRVEEPLLRVEVPLPLRVLRVEVPLLLRVEVPLPLRVEVPLPLRVRVEVPLLRVEVPLLPVVRVVVRVEVPLVEVPLLRVRVAPEFEVERPVERTVVRVWSVVPRDVRVVPLAALRPAPSEMTERVAPFRAVVLRPSLTDETPLPPYNAPRAVAAVRVVLRALSARYPPRPVVRPLGA